MYCRRGATVMTLEYTPKVLATTLPKMFEQEERGAVAIAVAGSMECVEEERNGGEMEEMVVRKMSGRLGREDSGWVVGGGAITKSEEERGSAGGA